jgi:hypothetical protein
VLDIHAHVQQEMVRDQREEARFQQQMPLWNEILDNLAAEQPWGCVCGGLTLPHRTRKAEAERPVTPAFQFEVQVFGELKWRMKDPNVGDGLLAGRESFPE